MSETQKVDEDYCIDGSASAFLTMFDDVSGTDSKGSFVVGVPSAVDASYGQGYR